MESKIPEVGEEPTPQRLRSQAWFGPMDKHGFIHRSWMRNQGHLADAFDGRPVIGIVNTWSELAPCNAHLRDLAERVKWGVLQAGGTPFEIPAMSLGETNLRPTAMLYRNLAAMEAEETFRANPIDGLVLLVGCDKTTPALIMAACSVDLPTIVVSGGPMLSGMHNGERLASGTAVWRFDAEVKAGICSAEAFMAAEAGLHRSAGHCMSMGTASSMAAVAEALGLTLPGNAAIPAVDARRRALAQVSGRRIVELVKTNVRPSDILTKGAFENAIAMMAALGGSTNAVMHLLAIAGRVGPVDRWAAAYAAAAAAVGPSSNTPDAATASTPTPATIPYPTAASLRIIDLDAFAVGRNVPTIVDLQPAGKGFMEDFFAAGGVPAVTAVLLAHNLLPDPDALTVSGRSVKENIAVGHPEVGVPPGAPVQRPDIILPVSAPLCADGGLIVLRGNLAPLGAVLKPSAATPMLMQHSGPAVVFHGTADLAARIDDPALCITERSVLVLADCGPKGYPGMAEVGNFQLPTALLKRGLRDILRISDARMSGTAYGTCVLHCAPEAAAGGPIALLKDGDIITLDAAGGTLSVDVSDEEFAARRALWQPKGPTAAAELSGYVTMYRRSVLQADWGADLDFLVGCRGAAVPKNNH